MGGERRATSTAARVASQRSGTACRAACFKSLPFLQPQPCRLLALHAGRQRKSSSCRWAGRERRRQAHHTRRCRWLGRRRPIAAAGAPHRPRSRTLPWPRPCPAGGEGQDDQPAGEAGGAGLVLQNPRGVHRSASATACRFYKLVGVALLFLEQGRLDKATLDRVKAATSPDPHHSIGVEARDAMRGPRGGDADQQPRLACGGRGATWRMVHLLLPGPASGRAAARRWGADPPRPSAYKPRRVHTPSGPVPAGQPRRVQGRARRGEEAGGVCVRSQAGGPAR